MSGEAVKIVTVDLKNPEYEPTAPRELQPIDNSLGFQWLSTDDQVRTLSNKNGGDTEFSGLLYVPVLASQSACNATALVPENATRRADLPTGNYGTIGLAPWQNPQCTLDFISAAQQDGSRALIFYIPGSGTDPPPEPKDPAWGLGDGGQWKSRNSFGVYALPGKVGDALMHQLVLYSGNLTSVPNGHQLADSYSPTDYIRLAADINTGEASKIPTLWAFLLIVLAILIAIVGGTSAIMHFVQRRRRRSLHRRIAEGEVDLEALGIRRLTVPQEVLDRMPLYPYTARTPTPSQPLRTLSKDSYFQTSARIPDDVFKSEEASGYVPSPGRRSGPTISGSQHQSSAFSQSNCAICLEDFVPNTTTVRELPCHHIYHPDCIDSFLRQSSSLCPMCKKSVLPKGYTPTLVTNGMVRRERMIHRMRDRINIREEGAPPGGMGDNGLVIGSQHFHTSRIRGPFTHRRPSASSPLEQPGSVEMSDAAPPIVAADAPSGSHPVSSEAPVSPTSTPPPRDQVQRRREWARLRAIAMLGPRRLGTPEAQALEQEEAGRSAWRKAVGKIWPGIA